MTEIIVAIITAVAAVITVIIQNHQSNKRVEESIKKIQKHDEEQYLAILRLTVMAEHMPISERIIAGRKYIDRGGNGDVKKYYEKLLAEHTK